ncbi:hypothetical protein FA15DRAFT_665184 [Coprinopsis marcescibilis]|uniref:F-box domain-containing protein n=1 Tax=Coprinopsis marcescibilis TaxID=230819 RepID=A0A5C3L635_COPMA|nr:hypothetical protein FA15DRAFT_665184 [Coprinopsis marcescibilis]
MERPILPLELLDLTIEHFSNDRATLLAASLTCRSFHQICQRILFTAYRLSTRKAEDDPLSPPQRLLRTLETSQRLALCMHTLIVGDVSDKGNLTAQNRLFDECRRPLSLVYACAKNLKRLEINAPLSTRGWSAIPIQSGLHRHLGQILSITHLSLRNVHTVWLSWLSTFPKLEELCMERVSFTSNSRLERRFDAGSFPISPKRIRLSLSQRSLDQFLHWICSNPNKFNLESLEELSAAPDSRTYSIQSVTLYHLSRLPTKVHTTLQRLECSLIGSLNAPSLNTNSCMDLSQLSNLRFIHIDYTVHAQWQSLLLPYEALAAFAGWLEGAKFCPNLKVMTIRLKTSPHLQAIPELATILEDILVEFNIETINLIFDDKYLENPEAPHIVLEQLKGQFPRLKNLERFNLTLATPARKTQFPSYYDR